MSLRQSYAWIILAALMAVAGSGQRASVAMADGPTRATQDTPPASQPQDPTFRAAADLVYVDVYPRRNGRIVEGLRAEDFRLREDGTPQAVELFEFVRVPGPAADLDPPEPRSPAEAERLAADPAHRVSVVYLDLYHTSRAASVQGRDALLQFVTRGFGPSDLIAAMTQEIPVAQLTFGRELRTLASGLITSPAWGRADEAPGSVVIHGPVEEEIAACGGRNYARLIMWHREDTLFVSLENLVARLGALRDARKNVFFFTETWTVPRGAPQQTDRPFGTPTTIPPIGSGRIASFPGPSQPAYVRQTICDLLVARLAGLGWEQRLRDLLRAASAANVSFYPVDLGGLQVGLPIARADERIRERPRNIPFAETDKARSLSFFRTLADNTDGRAVVDRNDIAAGLSEALDDIGSYYLLGYYSTNQALDGKYREIDVDIVPPRISVSARRGYVAGIDARPRAALAASAAAAAPPLVTAALDGLARLRDDGGLQAYAAAWDGEIHVVVEIAGREAASGLWRDGADADVLVRSDSDSARERRVTGRISAGARSTLVTVPADKSSAALAGAPVEHEAPPRTFTVSLRVTGSGDGALLEAEIPVASDADALASAPLVYRTTGPARSALIPAAAFGFRRGELLQLHWHLSNAASDWRARLVDRQGRQRAELVLVELPAPGGGARSLVTTLPLGSFAAGEYVIELTVTAGARVTQRAVAFRVVG